MSTEFSFPGFPPIIQTEDNRFEVCFGTAWFWFRTLDSAILFSIGLKQDVPMERVRAAAFLLGVADD